MKMAGVNRHTTVIVKPNTDNNPKSSSSAPAALAVRSVRVSKKPASHAPSTKPATIQRILAGSGAWVSTGPLPVSKVFFPIIYGRACPPRKSIPNYQTGDGEEFPFFNGSTGETLGVIKMDHLYRIHRPRLRSLLSEGLDIREAKSLTDLI
ncbi:MAG: hypothetical protein OHK93_002736 [Ramalina farinacea]|uniref:Uncharacterized protein n=1 Tax=Ramalina farinacea TaxID=258253 RepID=A0AA43QSR7_9LECA|nr:hypothetical protein [Ramalina farinacea]